MSNHVMLNLSDLLASIEKIELYSQNFLDSDDFYHDQKSFDATMMQFVVIGETIGRIDETFKRSHSHIPWQKIKDFRNIIAHDYFGVDADEIWDIICNKLLPLKADIQQLLTS